MPPLFPRWTDTFAKLVLLSIVATLIGGITLSMLWVRSPLFRRQFNPIEQPILFDHRHHVADNGIDCRYCHSSVDKGPSAGYPPTALCLNCHSQIWNRSPILAPLRAAYFSDRAIAWKRVHELPDFVYFNHSIHIHKGVGCVTCHGRVDTMAALEKVAPMTMSWCLGCHRDPTRWLRPSSEITNLEWEPPADGKSLALELAREYQVHTRTSCTTCHR